MEFGKKPWESSGRLKRLIKATACGLAEQYLRKDMTVTQTMEGDKG